MSQTNSVREKSAEAYRTISEVADFLRLPQHVLRFWETRFTQIKPLKRGGNRRYYRPEDVELLSAIRQLLYGEGYTIRGVQRLLRERGVRAVAGLAHGHPMPDLPAVLGASGAYGDVTAMTEADDPEADPTIPASTADRTGEFEGLAFLRGPADMQTKPRLEIKGEPTDQLRALLAELADCRRILDAARI